MCRYSPLLYSPSPKPPPSVLYLPPVTLSSCLPLLLPPPCCHRHHRHHHITHFIVKIAIGLCVLVFVRSVWRMLQLCCRNKTHTRRRIRSLSPGTLQYLCVQTKTHAQNARTYLNISYVQCLQNFKYYHAVPHFTRRASHNRAQPQNLRCVPCALGCSCINTAEIFFSFVRSFVLHCTQRSGLVLRVRRRRRHHRRRCLCGFVHATHIIWCTE